jgi:hypothetical protein
MLSVEYERMSRSNTSPVYSGPKDKPSKKPVSSRFFDPANGGDMFYRNVG